MTTKKPIEPQQAKQLDETWRALVRDCAKKHSSTRDTAVLYANARIKRLESLLLEKSQQANPTHKHPVQPLEYSKNSILRFKENKIVTYLLDKGPFDMNHLAVQGFGGDDYEQLAQLIGYSLDGFSTLSYATNEIYDAAIKTLPLD